MNTLLLSLATGLACASLEVFAAQPNPPPTRGEGAVGVYYQTPQQRVRPRLHRSPLTGPQQPAAPTSALKLRRGLPADAGPAMGDGRHYRRRGGYGD